MEWRVGLHLLVMAGLYFSIHFNADNNLHQYQKSVGLKRSWPITVTVSCYLSSDSDPTSGSSEFYSGSSHRRPGSFLGRIDPWKSGLPEAERDPLLAFWGNTMEQASVVFCFWCNEVVDNSFEVHCRHLWSVDGNRSYYIQSSLFQKFKQSRVLHMPSVQLEVILWFHV